MDSIAQQPGPREGRDRRRHPQAHPRRRRARRARRPARRADRVGRQRRLTTGSSAGPTGQGAHHRVRHRGHGARTAPASRATSRRHGHRVIEVNRPDRRERRLNGKSDALDAENAARAVLSGRATATPKDGRRPGRDDPPDQDRQGHRRQGTDAGDHHAQDARHHAHHRSCASSSRASRRWPSSSAVPGSGPGR